ncbi:response regulator transcription factor [Paenibacillus glucanolyticus]|uniref:response regulator transcription factor n=1 Tax=Paenibacillus glucanolyticus TaxID=59843 RepID=UPI00096DAF63|nr:response regulator [Paenibacillus glucanolyticus]OMF80247.1 DNA-binding response regulator [Paenibacillus glucanolyticus]
MMNVLIVDDEYEIREGLRRRVSWHEYGFETVRSASDGDEALLLAQEYRPDLIITDIKMNRMSGLEMLSELQKMEPHGWKAVLISGYDDFSLVKQAMHLGAIDYILKPINMEEMERIIRKSTDLIKQERLEQQNKANITYQVQFAVPKLREELLKEMVENDYDPYRESRISHRLKSLNLDWLKESTLFLMIVEGDDLKALANRQVVTDEKELVLFGIGNVVSQTLAEELCVPAALFRDSADRWVAVISCMDQGILENCKSVAEICLQRINQFIKVKASIALSPVPKEFKHLHALYLECGESLEQKVIYGGNRLFTESVEGMDMECEKMSIREPDAVLDLVRYGSEADIVESMKGFEDMVQSWELLSLKDIHQQIFQWLMGIYRAAAATGWPDRSWERDPIGLWERLEQYDTLQSLQHHVEESLLTLAGNFRAMATSSSKIVQEAEKMIRTRYSENLSLQYVASMVHVTPIWLSKLYKKEKGRTFLEDLTSVRIMRAKEMLGDMKYKIYQVSYEVGYKDPVHFSKLFKKQVGVTPKEFRRLRGIMDD